MKIDKKQLEKEIKENFKEILKFIKYWVDYIKSHSDKEWSKQQNLLIDSQIK